jgi:hypothetical protein
MRSGLCTFIVCSEYYTIVKQSTVLVTDAHAQHTRRKCKHSKKTFPVVTMQRGVANAQLTHAHIRFHFAALIAIVVGHNQHNNTTTQQHNNTHRLMQVAVAD